jgi:hypothetical protein
MTVPGTEKKIGRFGKAPLTVTYLGRLAVASSATTVAMGNLDFGASDPSKIIVAAWSLSRNSGLAGQGTVIIGGNSVTRHADTGSDAASNSCIGSLVMNLSGVQAVSFDYGSSFHTDQAIEFYSLLNADPTPVDTGVGEGTGTSVTVSSFAVAAGQVGIIALNHAGADTLTVPSNFIVPYYTTGGTEGRARGSMWLPPGFTTTNPAYAGTGASRRVAAGAVWKPLA